jgi:hypothetical protein
MPAMPQISPQAQVSHHLAADRNPAYAKIARHSQTKPTTAAYPSGKNPVLMSSRDLPLVCRPPLTQAQIRRVFLASLALYVVLIWMPSGMGVVMIASLPCAPGGILAGGLCKFRVVAADSQAAGRPAAVALVLTVQRCCSICVLWRCGPSQRRRSGCVSICVPPEVRRGCARETHHAVGLYA